MKFVILNYFKGSYDQLILMGTERYCARKYLHKNQSFFEATQKLFLDV